MANQPPETAGPSGEAAFQSRLSMQIKFSRDLGGEGAFGGGDEGGVLKPAWCVTGRRIFAFFLDVAVLIIIGRGATFVVADYFRRLGEDGWWMALAVAALYFTILDSSVTGGKTIGKRLMRIEVRKTSGAFLNPITSFVRFLPIGALFAAIFLLRGANPYRPLTWAIEGTAMFLALGIGTFALAHPRRQSLQDLLVGSVVVRSGGFFQFERAKSSDPAIVFVALLILVIVNVVPYRWLLYREPAGRQLSKLWSVVEGQEGLTSPKVTVGFFFGKDWTIDFGLSVSGYVKDPQLFSNPQKMRALSNAIAADLSRSGALPRGLSKMTVALRHGFDIGLWREMEVARQTVRLAPAGGGGGLAPAAPSTIFKVTPGRSRFRPEAQQGKKGTDSGKKGDKTATPPPPKRRSIITTPLR